MVAVNGFEIMQVFHLLIKARGRREDMDIFEVRPAGGKIVARRVRAFFVKVAAADFSVEHVSRQHQKFAPVAGGTIVLVANAGKAVLAPFLVGIAAICL